MLGRSTGSWRGGNKISLLTLTKELADIMAVLEPNEISFRRTSAQ